MSTFDVANGHPRELVLQPKPLTAAPADILILDAQPETYLPVLQHSFRVIAATKPSTAFESMTRIVPAALVADLDTTDGAADVIHRARSFSMPPAILATTSMAERAPDALLAGCDSILLKPFPPNLLFTRLSRLVRLRMQALRQRSVLLRDGARRQMAKSAHLHEREERLAAGCTREWRTTHCPYCSHEGVTSFDYASHRQVWYACLACKEVWLAKRRD